MKDETHKCTCGKCDGIKERKEEICKRHGVDPTSNYFIIEVVLSDSKSHGHAAMLTECGPMMLLNGVARLKELQTQLVESMIHDLSSMK